MRDLTGTEPWAWQTQRRHTDRGGGSRIGKKVGDVELIGSEMDLKMRSYCKMTPDCNCLPIGETTWMIILGRAKRISRACLIFWTKS